MSFASLKIDHPAPWAELVALGTSRMLLEGEVLFAERGEATHAYLVVEGLVEIYKETVPGNELRLAICEPDTLFGEGCLFPGARRSAHARAFQLTSILELPVEELRAFLASRPDFALAFYQQLAANQHRIISELDADLKSAHRRLRNANL